MPIDQRRQVSHSKRDRLRSGRWSQRQRGWEHARLSIGRAPVLLIHGDDDRNVRFIETLTLIRQLRAQGVSVEQLVLPDEIHGFLRHDSWIRAYESALDFFARKM